MRDDGEYVKTEEEQADFLIEQVLPSSVRVCDSGVYKHKTNSKQKSYTIEYWRKVREIIWSKVNHKDLWMPTMSKAQRE